MSSQPVVKWRQHLTLDLPKQLAAQCVWVHACSVGEVNSIKPLLHWLLNEQHIVHLTIVTATGMQTATRHFAEDIDQGRLSISFLPWDLPGLMRRWVSHMHPRLLLLTETEFWPGMLAACGSRNIPVIGINTRISDRSFPRYYSTRKLWQRWLTPVELFLAQSQQDAERIGQLGIDTSRIQNAGNLKYSIAAPEVDAGKLRQQCDSSSLRPILLMASTHAEEEDQLLAMWPQWKRTCPELLGIMVPRHPQRFDEVAALMESKNIHFRRWQQSDEAQDVDMILVDAMGVLGGLYCIADIAIIGGSLANVGGHNPLEASVCGRGVLTGPYVQNFREIMQQMQRAGAAIVCRDTHELQGAVLRLLKQPDELRQLNAQAALFMQDKTGVLEHICDAIRPWLAKTDSQTT